MPICSRPARAAMRLAVTASLALAAAASSARAQTTETEPNNTLAQANGIASLPANIAGAISPAGDADYFRFTVPAIGALTIETTDAGGPDSCESIDTIIFLFNPAGQVIASNNDSGVNACSRIDGAVDPAAANLAPGNYAVGVIDFGSNDVIPAYRLSITFTPRPATTGACCTTAGPCQITEPAACAGIFQGMGTTCQPLTCPNALSSCCEPVSGRCAVITIAACNQLGLAPRGEGTTCAPACPPPVGACCTARVCSIATASACTIGGGDWQGPLTTCTPATRCCRADFDGSGTVAVGDVLEFLGEYFAGCP